MRFWLLIAPFLFAAPAMAEMSVTAAVDQSRVAFGNSVTFTITVNGTHSSPQPAIPRVEGLTFAGPSVNTSVSIVNATMSQSVSLVYQITPTRSGEFTIPAIPITVAGKVYQTEPIKLTVVQGAVPPDTQQLLFLKVQMNRQQVYLGETAPLNVLLFTRADQDVKGLSGFTFEADGLGYKFLQNPKSGRQVFNGETFNVYVIEGAISPTRVGQLAFGPCAVKVHLAAPRKRRGNDFFDDFFGRVETREVPVINSEVPIDVLPLPEEGKPADFTGAVGQWNLELDAKPTDIAVGDPITVTIKIAGNGNIDTVSTPALKGLEKFKTYDPTSKTTKNELSTTGERLFQQVLMPKSTEATELPGVRLSYFDPVAKTYQTVERGAIKLQVKAGTGGASAVVSGATRSHPAEKLGEDIVYLKGDPGPVGPAVPLSARPVFWVLNGLPVLALAGGIGWKRRIDRLRGDVAFARRSRAARAARKLLAAAASFDGVQHALRNYLGDRLNIPASGITASVVEEHGLPKDVTGVFEACDAARFAGAPADLAGLKKTVERVIDELEDATL